MLFDGYIYYGGAQLVGVDNFYDCVADCENAYNVCYAFAMHASVCYLNRLPVNEYPNLQDGTLLARQCTRNDQLLCDHNYWLMYLEAEVAVIDDGIPASSVQECLSVCEAIKCCHAVNWIYSAGRCQVISTPIPDIPPKTNEDSIHLRRCDSPIDLMDT